jgi:ribosomal protein S6--L-glutamate ligase
MRRQSDSWITNVHQGGRPEAWDPPADAASLAIAATQVTGATFAGVDLIEDGAGGYMVLEVNSMPAWSGLQSVSNVVIGDLLAGDFADAAAMGLRV